MSDFIHDHNYMINDLPNRRGNLFAGVAIDYKAEENKFYFYCDNGVVLFVHVISEILFVFRFSPDGNFPTDFSYAIDPGFYSA